MKSIWNKLNVLGAAFAAMLAVAPVADARLTNYPSSGGAATPTLRVLDVTANGAVAGDTGNNTPAVQALIDANPNGVIYFPAGTYRFNSTVILTNASGKAFAGGIKCDGSILKFYNSGSASDTDANMQNGFVAYPKTNGAGGDTSGWGDTPQAKIEGCIFDGPANGAGLHLANGIVFQLDRVEGQNARYGILIESSINARLNSIRAKATKNCGLAFKYTGNPNVYYGSSPTSTFWNDAYVLKGYTYSDGATDGTFAGLCDDGSNAERVRSIDGISCQGKTGKTGVQYCYFGRLVHPHFHGANWAESVKYALRIISSNSAEGGSGTAIPGVTAAQPNGTMTVGDFPDGYCTGGVISGFFVSGATTAFQPDCNGEIHVGEGVFTTGTTVDLKSTQGGKTLYYHKITRSDGTPAVIQNSFGGFVDQAGATPSISSGFGTSPPALPAGSNSLNFTFQIGTGGTANSGVLQFDATAPTGWNCRFTNLTTTTATVFQTKQTARTTTTATVGNFNTSGAAAAWTAGDTISAQCQMM